MRFTSITIIIGYNRPLHGNHSHLLGVHHPSSYACHYCLHESHVTTIGSIIKIYLRPLSRLDATITAVSWKTTIAIVTTSNSGDNVAIYHSGKQRNGLIAVSVVSRFSFDRERAFNTFVVDFAIEEPVQVRPRSTTA